MSVAIFQFDDINAPVEFARFLTQEAVPYHVVRLDQQQPMPENLQGISGICLMGGPMMVSDNLPWMPQLFDLLRQAIAEDVPVIGHCLGAQLLAHALGASVAPHPHHEIGWVDIAPDLRAKPQILNHWLGEFAEHRAIPVFQWHFQAFTIPQGATQILTNPMMPTQAFVIGPHLAMQFHVEVDAPTVDMWFENSGHLPSRYPGGQVQTVAEALAAGESAHPVMRRLGNQLYAAWLMGMRI